MPTSLDAAAVVELAQGFLSLGPVDYANGAPENYRCTLCKVSGVKLWRSVTNGEFLDPCPLLLCCAACSEEIISNGQPLDYYRRLSIKLENSKMDLRRMPAAIPTQDGSAFFHVDCTPLIAEAWWMRLPMHPEPKKPEAPEVEGMLSYDAPPPDFYHCSVCKEQGLRLWLNVTDMKNPLLCHECHAGVLAELTPAIPLELLTSMSCYWHVQNVPKRAVAWWLKLPLRPTPKEPSR